MGVIVCMRKLRTVALVFGLFLVSYSTVEQSASARIAVPPAQVTKRALLVGINKYRYSNVIPPLAGSINDIEDMKALLIGKFNFAPENILVLTDEKATHAGVIAAFENHLINKSQPGDIVVIHYSGHGSQMKDVTGQSPSGLDETLVPYDSRDPDNKVFDISGSELKPLFRRLAEKTKNITVILDSCHSGTLVKGIHRVRMIPPDQRQPPVPTRPADTNRGLAVGLSPKVQNTFLYALIAAANSREVAFEHSVDGKERGALTYFLTRALRSAGPETTYRDVMDAVMGNVTLNYPTQHPQLEGLQADQHVFGDTDSAAQAYVLASALPDGRISIGSGQVHGITAGSVFDVYAPGAKSFDPPQRPTATIEITEVQPFVAYAKLVSGGMIQNFSRAVERQHNYRGLQLLVYFDSSLGTAQLRSLTDALVGYKHVQVVTDPNLAHLFLKRDGNSLLTLGADQTVFSPPIALSDPDLLSKFKGQIDQWARWFNTLSIRNTGSAVSAGVQIKTKKNGATKDPFAQIGPAGPTVYVDEEVEVTVSNKSKKDVYFALLDLQTDGSITLIYPPAGAHEILKAESSFTKSFYSYLPEKRTEVIDVVMLVASIQQFDPALITQPPTKGVNVPEDPVGKVFAFARGLRPDPPGPRPNTPGVVSASSTGPISVGEWVTDQKVLKVRAN
jgi:hypothetical protein